MHTASLADVDSYGVELEFTEQMEPSLLNGEGLPFVSVEDEIVANTYSLEGQQLRVQYGRIPYGTPLYVWERGAGSSAEVLYVGMTTKMTTQARFLGHAAVVKLLADHVNLSGTRISFRLCSRFDVHCTQGGVPSKWAIEHFSPEEARGIVLDVEARLVNQLKPHYNSNHVHHERVPGKPFTIDRVVGLAACAFGP